MTTTLPCTTSSTADSQEEGVLYALVLDLNPRSWMKLEQEMLFEEAMNHICVFINSHLSLKIENKVAVFGAVPQKSAMLYPSSEVTKSTDDRQDLFAEMNATILNNIAKLNKQCATESSVSDLPGAISRALCYINCHANKPHKSEPSTSFRTDGSITPLPSTSSRIGVVSVSSGSSLEYFAMMNCLFAAQRKGISIDVCAIGTEASVLQQASHLTNGIYLFLHSPQQLLQNLLMGFGGSSASDILLQPKQTRIGFQASCFCHGNTIEIGFVCTVCLAEFTQRGFSNRNVRNVGSNYHE
eukprot:gene10472-2602_t